MKKFIILLLFSIFFVGCSNKQPTKIIIKNNYVYTKVPTLKIFDNNSSLKINAYNEGDDVCVEEWKACIPKKEMIKLIEYTHSLKKTISLYKNEVLEYNKWAREHNKKIK